MSDSRVKEIIRQGNKLFSDKEQIDNLWEELALNFYPERADFVSQRYQGEEYADHLYASMPVLARRELGNLLSSSLRPTAKKWFSIHVMDKDVDHNTEVRQYLEMLSEIQWRAVYEPAAQFTRATKQADHDFVTFGNAVIHFGLNIAQDSLLFRNFHLRDCAWAENYEGRVDQLHRRWKPTAWQLKEMYGDGVSNTTKKLCEKDPAAKVEVRHVVVPAPIFDYKNPKKQFPYQSLVVEVIGEHVLESQPIGYFPYCVPRWHTMADSAYGLSMATMVLLPDGRTVQSVIRTIRQAGEKYVEPPMIAIADAIRSDVAMYPGGITTADMEYDERLGEVLRPLTQDKGALPVGFDIAEALRQDINHGFFLDKIQLPAMNAKEMTAFEVQRRVQEHIRAAAPIFEPIEQDYSAPLMEGVFNLLQSSGAFPPSDEMPDALSSQGIKFSFNSPLSEMADQSDLASFQNVVSGVLGPMMELDPAQLENANMTQAVRDAMRAGGWKADWFNDEEAVDEKREQIEQQKQAMMQMQMAQAGAGVMKEGGQGMAALKGAQPDEEQA